MMTSLVRDLPLLQVLGDIEIAQTLKKNQEEASQKLEVREGYHLNTLITIHYLQLEEVPHPLDVNYELLQTNMKHIKSGEKIHKVHSNYDEGFSQ